MAASATKTFDLEGIAESFEDMVFMISPQDTYYLTNAKRMKVGNTTHQWLTDSLAAASATNANLEGDDATFTTATTAVLYSNQTQIMRKTVEVSRTADTVKKYGRGETFAYELAKKTKEIKRDAEAMFLSNNASTAGSVTSARVSAGLAAMIGGPLGGGNRIIAGSGTTTTVPGYASGQWAASADGTAGAATALTETHLKSALQAAWEDGGDPSVILVPPFQKARIATFAGAQAFAGFYNPQAKAVQGAVVGAVDVYVSDFGSHKVVLSRYMPTNRVYCLDPDYIGVGVLDSFKVEQLAKTGDGTKGMIIAEMTTILQNPDASAQIIGLTSS
jgi:hypothetical protein